MINLSNKVIVITGGSEGLGHSIANRLVELNAKVWILSRNTKAKDFKEINHIKCDLSSENEIISAIKKVYNSSGVIDVLINNAGVWTEGNIETYTLDKIQKVFDVNINGLMRVTGETIKYLKNNRFSQILNVISTSGLVANENWSVYTASKFALKGFTESIKQEVLKDSIRVMAIYPGGIDTDFYMNANVNVSRGQSWMMKTSIIVDSIIFMLTCSEDSVINHLEINKFN